MISCQDDDNLPFRFFLLEMGCHFVERTSYTLLVNLRYLTAYTYLTVAAIHFRKLLQCLYQPVR